MLIGDLVFIVLVLTTLSVLLRALYLLMRGRYAQSTRVFGRLAIGLAIYFAALIAVSLLSPRKVLAMGQDRCFDDWCLAVESATTAPDIADKAANGKYYIVTLRVSSQAKRVSQRALDASVHLEDDRGNTYEPSDSGQRAYEAQHGPAKALFDRLEPGEFFNTVRVFDVPRDAGGLGLVVLHGAFLGHLIIGDSQSFLHKRTMTLLN